MIDVQPGPRSTFLALPADIAIYGWAAGAGKSYAFFLCPISYLAIPGFNVALFLRKAGDQLRPGRTWEVKAGATCPNHPGSFNLQPNNDHPQNPALNRVRP